VAASRGSPGVARLMVGTCIYRIRTAAVRTFWNVRFGPGFENENALIQEQLAAHKALQKYLLSLEDLRHNLFMLEDRFDFTPVHYALRDAYQGCLPTLKLMLGSCFEFGDTSHTDPLMTDNRFQAQPGSTMMSLLGSKVIEHELETLRQQHLKRSYSIRDGLCNARDPFGLAPLHYAAAEGNYRAVHLLVKFGADVSARSTLADRGGPRPGSRPIELSKDAATQKAFTALASVCISNS